MVGRWGMSERIGRLSVLPVEGDPRMSGISDGLLDAVDEEVRRITDECYGEARRLLKQHRNKLDAIVAQLHRWFFHASPVAVDLDDAKCRGLATRPPSIARARSVSLRLSEVLRLSRDPIRYMLAGPAFPEAFMRLAPRLPDDRRCSWPVDLRLITNEPQ